MSKFKWILSPIISKNSYLSIVDFNVHFCDTAKWFSYTQTHTHIHTYTQSQTWHLSFYMQRMVYSSCPCSGKPEKCFLWKITLVVGITVVSLLLLWIACFRFYFNYFTYVILSNPYDILWGWYYHYSFFWEANTYIFHFNPVRLVLISPWFSDEGIKP